MRWIISLALALPLTAFSYSQQQVETGVGMLPKGSYYCKKLDAMQDVYNLMLVDPDAAVAQLKSYTFLGVCSETRVPFLVTYIRNVEVTPVTPETGQFKGRFFYTTSTWIRTLNND